MIEVLKEAEVSWKDGAPWSAQFEDIYYSPGAGLEASNAVFVEPNQLGPRFKTLEQDFVLAETGFGTGLNFFATLALWSKTRQGSASLTYITTELFPLELEVVKKVAELEAIEPEISKILFESYPSPVKGHYQIDFEQLGVKLVMLWGDALESLNEIEVSVDAWYLDGFAPRCNSELWSKGLFKRIANLSSDQATFSTFSAAGEVRRGLKEVGFEVEKIPGFASKKHSSRGVYSSSTKTFSPHKTQTKASLVIGAGIAGCSLADSLSRKGLDVTLIEEGEGIASGATGNPRAIVVPYLGNQANSLSQFYHLGFFHLLRRLKGIESGSKFHNCGALQLESCYRLKKLASEFERHSFPESVVKKLSVEEASELSGVVLKQGGFYLPKAGFIDPRSFCSTIFESSGAKLISGVKVDRLQRIKNKWCALDSAGEVIASAEQCVVANAWKASQFEQTAWLPLEAVRGQCLSVKSRDSLKVIVCHEGYITPADQGESFIGASYAHDDFEEDARRIESEEMLDKLQALGLATEVNLSKITCERVGFRTSTYDRAPYVGEVDKQEDLYISVGFGSRGISTAGLAAEIIAEQSIGSLLSVPKKIAESLSPARYLRSKKYLKESVG